MTRGFVWVLVITLLAGCLAPEPPASPDDADEPAGDVPGPSAPHDAPPLDPPMGVPPHEAPDEADEEPPFYEAGRFEYALEHNGLERWGKVYVPPGLPVGEAVPLLVLVHAGSGGPNHVFRVTEIEPLADEYGFIVLTPTGHPIANTDPVQYDWRALDCCKAGEEDPDDAGFILASIERVRSQYAVDGTRIGIAGHSEGATMAYMVGVASPQTFRYVAAVAGYVGVQKAPGLPWTWLDEPSAAMTVVISHSTDDPQVPYHGGVGPLSLKPWLYKSSVADAIMHFTAGFSAEPTVQIRQEGSHAVQVYEDPTGDGRVVHYRTTGGHNWPGIDDADMFPYTVLVQTPDDPYFPQLMVDWLWGDVA